MALPDGIKSVEQLAVEGKRVFVRVDYNVPLEKGTKRVTDDARIRATLPTLEHLVKRGARIVLGSHLGRPDGQVKPEYSLEPVAAKLAEMLGTDVALDQVLDRRQRRADARVVGDLLVLGERDVEVDAHEDALALDGELLDVLDAVGEAHGQSFPATKRARSNRRCE